MYWWARGCTKDPHEAMKWFQASAHEGYALAQYQIGQMYQHGTDAFPQHLETARDYLQLASQQGLDVAVEAAAWVKERLWTPDLDEMRQRAEDELALCRRHLGDAKAQLVSQRSRHVTAKARADDLDKKLLVELETQRKIKRELFIAQEMLERESERATIVETELATQQVRNGVARVRPSRRGTRGAEGA